MGNRAPASHCHQLRARQKMPEAPAGWTQVNTGVKGWCLPLCRALEGSRHGLCRRPSSWGSSKGACTHQAPAFPSCPVLWLPGATGLVAPRLPRKLSPAPPHTPPWQAGYAWRMRTKRQGSLINLRTQIRWLFPFQSLAQTEDNLRTLTGIPKILWNLSQVPTCRGT